MIPYYLLLVCMTVIGSLASLFLKKASSSVKLLAMLKNFNLYMGAGLYLLSALLNIYILKVLDYSIVLPLTSITYIWTLFFSGIVLKEKISEKKIVGILLILFGAVLVSLR